MSKVTSKTQKTPRAQSSKGTSSGRGDVAQNPDKEERRVQILERENMMLRKNLNMTDIMKEFKRSFSENDMQQMFFESLHELQQKLMQYESGKGPVSGSLSDLQIDLDKERQSVRSLEQEVNEKNKLLNEKDKELKGFRTELDLQRAHVRHAAEAVKKLEKMQLEYDELKKQNLVQNTTIKGQSDEIARLKKQLAESERSTMSLQEEMSEIEQLRSELRDSVEGQEALTKEIQGLKKELTRSDRKYREAEAMLKANEKTLEERNSVIKQLNTDSQSHDQLEESYGDRISGLLNTVSEQDRKMKQLSEENIVKEQSLTQLRRTVIEQEGTVKQLQEENVEIVRTLEKERTTLEERNAVIKKLNEEKRLIDEQAGGTAGKVSELLNTVTCHENTIQKLTEEKLETEKKFKEMSDTLEQRNTVFKSLETEKQKILDMQEIQDKELAELREKQSASEKLIAELKENTDHSQNSSVSPEELREKNEHISRLKEELAQAKRSIERLKAEKDKLEFICHEAFDKLTQKEKLMKSQEEEHKKKMERKDEVIQKLRREMTIVDPTAGGSVKVETKSLVEKYERTEKELTQARDEIDELKNRLGKIVGATVLNGNPDIMDLSDVNKPTRLAEKFSQVYDNEWTDAYEEAGKGLKSEEQTVAYLYKTLEDVFDFCKTIAEEHAKSIHACVLTVPYAANGRPKSAKIDGAKLRQLKELRKSFAPYLAESVFHHFVNTLKLNLVGKKKTELFIKRCVEVCWLMNAQDPPVILDTSNDKGKAFDQDRFKTYTRSGRTVDYVVWPPVLLHRNGSLLCKGVAQGK